MPDSIDQPLSNDAEQSPDSAVTDLTNAAKSGVVLGFRPKDRRVMTVLMSGLLLWLTVEWILVATRRPDDLLLQRGPDFQSQFRIHINNSIWVDWMQLEGIGPVMAQRIIADREMNGPFSSIDDLSRVPGIGAATLDQMRPWLTTGHDAMETRSADAAIERPSGTQSATTKRKSKTR